MFSLMWANYTGMQQFEPIREMFAFYWNFEKENYERFFPGTGTKKRVIHGAYGSPLELCLMNHALMTTMARSPDLGPDIWAAYKEETGKEPLAYSELLDLQNKLLALVDGPRIAPS
jgi:hypothetical protein